MDEAHRLYQMFKNAVFLTLVRGIILILETLTARRLFDALASANIKNQDASSARSLATNLLIRSSNAIC